MAKRFEATATRLQDGLDYRVDIYDARFSGTVSTLQDERQFFSIPVGEADDTGQRVFKPREISLSLIQTADVSVLTDAGPSDVRVEVVRTGSGNTIFKGFLFPNRFQDQPLGLQPDVVTLQGTEGLPTLQDVSFGDLGISGNDRVEPMTTIRTILNQVYDANLSIKAGITWWPYSGGAGAELNATDLSPQWVEFDPEVYREDRDEDDSDWWSCYEVLEDLLIEYASTVQQSVFNDTLVWHIRQRTSFLDTGELRLWTVQPDGITTHEGLVNVREDLSTLDDTRLKVDHHREFEQQRKSVTVTHDHTEVENFLEESGFEDGGAAWTAPSSDMGVSFPNHADRSVTPSPSTENQRLAQLAFDTTLTYSPNEQYGLEQPFFLVRPGKEAFLRIAWSGWQQQSFLSLIQVEAAEDGVFFESVASALRAGSLQGDVELPVDPITAPIAQGQKIPISKSGETWPSAFLTVDQRAEVGDDVLIGELSDQVASSWNIRYVAPTTTAGSTIPVENFMRQDEEEQWNRHAIFIPFQDPSGNRLTSNRITARFGANMAFGTGGTVEWYLDDISIQPITEGKVLAETVCEASDGMVGEEEAREHRLGSGPATTSISRMHGQSRSGTPWNAFLWGDAPDTSNVYPISELHARQRLRHMSRQNQRLETTVLVEDGEPDLFGHELVRLSSLVLWNQLDGDADSKVGPDGTINGDPQPAVGVSGGAGQALDFDGAGDYVDVGTASDFDFGASDSFTVSCWFKTTVTGDFAVVFGKGNIATTDSGWFFHWPPFDNFAFYVGDGSTDADVFAGNIADGNWHHGVMVVDRSTDTLEAYLDGESKGTADISGIGSLETGRVPAIGRESGETAYWNGAIDEPRIYDRALSAGEVGYLYANPLSGRRDALGGKQYTISSIETRPTMGETQLNLLEHQDFGT